MSSLGLKLKSIRKQNDLTMEELRDRLNNNHGLSISKSMISRWENGIAEPLNSSIAAYAKEFSVDMNWLLGLETVRISTKNIKIPILGSVPAGVPIEAVQDILGYVELDESLNASGQFFALKISGDSMAHKIDDGDVVIVRRQSDLESGEVGVVYVNGYQATCKKILKNESGLILQPLNAAYDSAAFSWDEVENLPIVILGKVIEIRRYL